MPGTPIPNRLVTRKYMITEKRRIPSSYDDTEYMQGLLPPSEEAESDKQHVMDRLCHEG